MDKKTLQALKKKGLRRFLGDYRKRKEREKARAAIEGSLKEMLSEAAKLSGGADGDTEALTSMAGFAEANRALLSDEEKFLLTKPAAAYLSDHQKELREGDEALKAMVKPLWALEDEKRYRHHLMAQYLKGRYPAIYSGHSGEPVEDKVIVMESGKSPSPSSKRLAKTIEAQGRYRVVYMGLRIREIPMAVFYENGEKFIRELATAKAVFLSTANNLLSQFDLREETKVIQLWHGVGAFKHVGHSTVNNKHFGRNQKLWDEYDSYRNYSCVTIASDDQRWIFEESMQLPPGKLLAVGIARTDIFYDKDFIAEARRKLNDSLPQINGRKLLRYAPTFRGKVGEGKAPDRLDIGKLAEALSDEYVLLIKHHGLSKDVPPIPDGLEDSFAFDMNSHKLLDIDSLLAIADVLITDYSSVAFEFSITGRPIIFFTYDLDQYVEERGLYFDFRKEAPGPLCFDTEDIVNYMNSIAGPSEWPDRQKLVDFRDKYVRACDGHATERTIALIEQ